MTFCITISTGNDLFSQTSLKKLEQKRIKNKKDIKYTNDLLKSTIKSKINSIGDLNILKQKIDVRNRILKHIDQELYQLNGKISLIENNIDSLNLQLKQLKITYAKLACHSYKKRNSYNKLMFILSSHNFTQAYRRYKYFQQLSDYSKRQVVSIKKQSLLLKGEKQELQVSKNIKIKLLKEKKLEKRRLNNEHKLKSVVLVKLNTKEKQLRKNLERQGKQAEKLNKEIHRIIKLQAQKNNKLKSSTVKQNNSLSKSFARNKGKLPWPTSTGFVSSNFGVHTHDVLKYVKVKNDGIDITTRPNSSCLSIFNGLVEQIIAIPGLNHVIIISHGDYYSVYSNIIDVSVKLKQNVITGQKLGVVAKGVDTNQTILKLQIWESSTKLNPRLWLLAD